jgi:hypothetical protein
MDPAVVNVQPAAVPMDLQSLVTETHDKLESIWKNVGLAPKEKRNVMENLYESVKAVFYKAIDDESKMQSHYRTEIVERQNLIRTAQDELDVPVDVADMGEAETLIAAATRLTFQLEALNKVTHRRAGGRPAGGGGGGYLLVG